jgi:hypothetical protein
MVDFKINVGDKVHYIPFKGCNESQYQNGIVKSLHDDGDKVFVVYHCADEWDNYKNYTGALTNVNQLKKGWT